MLRAARNAGNTANFRRKPTAQPRAKYFADIVVPEVRVPDLRQVGSANAPRLPGPEEELVGFG